MAWGLEKKRPRHPPDLEQKWAQIRGHGPGIGPTATLFLQICDRAHFLATNPWPKNGPGIRTAFFAKFSTLWPVSGVDLRPPPWRPSLNWKQSFCAWGVLLKAGGFGCDPGAGEWFGTGLWLSQLSHIDITTTSNKANSCSGLRQFVSGLKDKHQGFGTSSFSLRCEHICASQ